MVPKWATRAVSHPRVARAALATGVLAATCAVVAVSLITTPSGAQHLPSEAVAAGTESTAELASHGDEHGHGGVSAEDSEASASELAHSVYAAASTDELEGMRSEALKKLVADALAKGLPVDPAWLDDEQYSLGSLKALAWPIDNYFISDHFGTRGGNHMGIDLAAGAGEPIGAAAPGVVIASSDRRRAARRRLPERLRPHDVRQPHGRCGRLGRDRRSSRRRRQHRPQLRQPSALRGAQERHADRSVPAAHGRIRRSDHARAGPARARGAAGVVRADPGGRARSDDRAHEEPGAVEES